MPPRLGWKRDPDKAPGEPPDHDAAPLLGALAPPAKASAEELIVEVLDQHASDCVIHAGFQAVRASQVKQGQLSPPLASRLFGYWNSRAFHHATDQDDGTYLRTFFEALNRFGFCQEYVYPYDTSKLANVPPWAAYQAGFDQHEPTVYKRIGSAGRTRLDDIKRAIAGGFLVCFGTLVSEDFARNQLGNEPLAPPIGKPIAGGHALCVVAYEDDVFKIVNSWSEDWGAKGYCEFAGDYLIWAESNDFWIVEKSPEYSG